MSEPKDAEPIDVAAVKRLLMTRYEDVFELSEDGTTYKKPASLFGVPVAKIQEESPYWNPNWLSLNAYLAKEKEEEQLKLRSRERKAMNPTSKLLKDEAKRHQDNVSKHRKICEIFGSSEPCHPNQVVAKRHLPPQGLCEQEIMYMLGCKTSDFQFLFERNLMGMKPWDFIRWRIGEQLQQRNRPQLPGAKVQVRTVINNMVSQKSEDPLFRQAILYSAHLGNRSGSYGSKREPRTYLITGSDPLAAIRRGTASSHLSKVHRSARINKPAVHEREAEEKARRDRRAKRAQQAQQHQPAYQGVNAYRQQKTNTTAPCSG